VGQLWYNRTTETLLVYGNSGWQSVSVDRHVESIDDSRLVSQGEVDLVRNAASGFPPITLVNIAHETGAGGFAEHVGTSPNAHPAEFITYGGTDTQNAIENLFTDVFDHINDPTAAHNATAISLPTGIGIIGDPDDVQEAIDNLLAELAIIDGNITGDALTDHINDPVDAHDASAISVPTGLGLPGNPTDVQTAIENINASVGVGGSGVLGVSRFVKTGPQAIGTSTKIVFPSIELDTGGGQYSTGTSTYTATFQQEVNVTVALKFTAVNESEGEIQIRRNGGIVRRSRFTNFDNSFSTSILTQDYAFEISIKLLLAFGDTVEVYGAISPGSGNVLADATGTFVEFDVVRDLS
jgi:hypothetical protein